MVKKFDAIVIGTGQSGPYLAKKCAEKGYKVAIVEENHFGGSCINTGCTPTKTLVGTAKIARSIQRAEEFGMKIGLPEINYTKVKARKDQMVTAGSEWVKHSLKETKGCSVYEGHASFMDSHHIQVGSHILEGEKFFINVGAKPKIPEISGLQNIPYLTNISLLNIAFVPKHLLILGGGYIGLEFAQVYRRLGSTVTVIQRAPYIMPKEDPDVSEAIREILEKEGIKFYTHASYFEILPGSQEGKILAKCISEGKEEKLSASHLLVATGRVPNTDKLAAEKAGVQLDQKGYIIVDETLLTSQPHIWALGDCNGRGAFTHTSYNDFEIVFENLFKGGKRKISERIPIYALFIDPPLGRVGLNEKEANQLHPGFLTAKLPMTSVARAREKGETEGFLKILIDPKSKQILGASFLGTSCDEVIQLIAVVMYAKAPYTLLERAVFIHPTVTEMIPTLFSKLEF